MLEGMLVVELAYYYPGPYCCRILRDLGADVVKVEPPAGDPMRYRPEIFAVLNRGKRIVKLNLKEDGDREEFYRLAEKADVIVEGFRPGVARRLGVDYERISEINEGIVYCSITGFGQNSRFTRPVHDINVLAMAGVCEVAGMAGGEPSDPNVQLSDFSSAVFAAITILSAYVRKLRTGKGAYIDLSMFDSALASIPLHTSAILNSGEYMRDFSENPGYRIYRAKDCYVSLGILDEPQFWDEMCRALGLDFTGMSFEERLKRSGEIEAAISARFAEMDREDIERAFGERIPYGIVESLGDVAEKSWMLEEFEFEGKRFRGLRFPARMR
ncbi:MAG: CoA transferase [Archaeoglobi archaeon]|nr:CoA transferase [Archaeoglobi archaeon]